MGGLASTSAEGGTPVVEPLPVVKSGVGLHAGTGPRALVHGAGLRRCCRRAFGRRRALVRSTSPGLSWERAARPSSAPRRPSTCCNRPTGDLGGQRSSTWAFANARPTGCHASCIIKPRFTAGTASVPQLLAGAVASTPACSKRSVAMHQLDGGADGGGHVPSNNARWASPPADPPCSTRANTNGWRRPDRPVGGA